MSGKKNAINVIEYDLEEALDFIRQKWNAGLYKVPILLAGQPGIGKTEGIQSIFSGVPVYEHRIGNMDPSDVRGVPVIDQITKETAGNDGNIGDFICREALPDGNVLPRTGPCVLFLDELGHAKTATLNAWMPLLKERKIGTYRAPENMLIIGATNRVSDRAGSNAMHSALINRVIRIDVKHNPKGWLKWASTVDPKSDNETEFVCSEIRSYIAWKNDALLQPNEDAQSVDSPFPSPRSWTNLSREISKLPSKKHWQMIANGTIGQAAAIEWIKFTEIYSQLPRWEDIAADPKGIPVPTDLSVKWALVGYLSDTCKNKQLVNKKQLDALCQFIVRLPSDFSVLAFNPIINSRTTDLMAVPAFKNWIQKNRHHVTNTAELLI